MINLKYFISQIFNKQIVLLAIAGVFLYLINSSFLNAETQNIPAKSSKFPKKSIKIVNLIPYITVEKNHILLGEIFTNVGIRANSRVAYSPKPGKSARFDAKWLYRIARVHGLKWRPLSLKTHVIVERASYEIYEDEVLDALRKAFYDRGYQNNIEIDMNNRRLNIHVATDKNSMISVTGLTVKKKTGRFIATLIVPGDSTNAQRFRLTGRVHRLINIPTLSRNFKRNDVIKKNDIEWIKVRSHKLRNGVLQDDEEIVGMAAKRRITSNTPLTSNHLQRPKLVNKGDLVTVSLTSLGLQLTTRGRAQDSGSKGDIIRIKNNKSKKIIEAKVFGEDMVIVDLFNKIAFK
jgi:flagella basal body P-ring formation protein FlgA